MRQVPRSLSLAFAFFAVLVLTAANSHSMAVMPNPAPFATSANKLEGHGTCTLDPGYMLGGVRFETTLKSTTQVTYANATLTGFNWDSTLIVAPSTYNPTKSIMTVIDAKMVPIQYVNAAPVDYPVK